MAWYEVDSLAIVVGSVAWGDLSRTTTDDGNKLGLNEVAAAPGFDYQFAFASIPAGVYTFRFKLNGYYQGSASHTVLAQAYNYTLATWVTLGMLVSRTSDFTYIFPTIPSSDYVDSGAAKIRFLHSTSGTVGHYLRIDQLIIEVITTTTAPPTTSGPTTVPPTTLAPTTTLTTGAPPTTVVGTSPIPTTLAPTTAPPTSIAPTTIAFTTEVPTTPPPHNPDLDTVFNCWAYNYKGVLIVETSIDGDMLSASYGMDWDELAIPVTISGSFPTAALIDADGELEIETSISGDAIANDNMKNWVAWSKIGNVSFALDLTNDAGFKPMDWAGYIYQVKRLGKDVMIYGGGGVTRGYPVTSPVPTFGFKNMLDIGVKNKTAIAGDEFVHFFIDVQGCLYGVTISTSSLEPAPKIERLGYEEYLRDLVYPTMHWDADKRRLYISDANNGFVYNAGALTGGYANLTGLYRVKQVLTAVSPDTIVAEPVEIWTDIIDFEHSGLKSIESTQYNAHSAVPLEGAIRYRYENQEEFKQTKWSPLNHQGISHMRAAGIEFKVGIRGLDWGTFNLSYIKINFKYIDQRFTRDPRRPLKEY